MIMTGKERLCQSEFSHPQMSIFGDKSCMKKTSPFSYEQQRLQVNLSKNYSQRFDLLMRLIRINRMLKNAKILPNQSRG